MGQGGIVVIGGGTGSHVVLQGLKRLTTQVTAIVAMTDSGGSSGRVREELGQLPPGDVRQCLVALSPDDQSGMLLRQLFDYRFDRGPGLNGHSFGNLFLAALTEITGSTAEATAEAGRLLNIKGTVLPVTLTKTELCARLVDGTELEGEANLDQRKERLGVKVDYVFLKDKAFIYPPAAEAIENAQAIVLAPGDLYTSIIPNLLVDGVPQAIQRSNSPKILVCNLMTKPGESDGFKASDFVKETQEYLAPRTPIHYLITNNTTFPEKMLERYRLDNAFPVECDLEECQKLVGTVLHEPLLAPGVPLRHDSDALGQIIYSLVAEGSPRYSREPTAP